MIRYPTPPPTRQSIFRPITQQYKSKFCASYIYMSRALYHLAPICKHHTYTADSLFFSLIITASNFSNLPPFFDQLPHNIYNPVITISCIWQIEAVCLMSVNTFYINWLEILFVPLNHAFISMKNTRVNPDHKDLLTF